MLLNGNEIFPICKDIKFFYIKQKKRDKMK